MAMVTCPVCGLSGEAGSFCEMGCGRLPEAAAAESPQEMPFELAYTVPETMWKDENSVVVFRFLASGDHFSDLTLILRNGKDELGRQALGRRPGNVERSFRFNVRPRFAGGCIDLAVDIVCQRDGAEGAEIYSAGFSVAVRDEKPQTINVHDINIGSGSAIYKGLNFSHPQGEDHVKSSTKTVDGTLSPELVASPRKLSLLSGDKVVQLLAVADGEVLTFGRLSDTTVPVRVYDRETRQLDRMKSKIISGIHFRLQSYEGRKLRVFDGCEERASSNGSLCGEVRISQDGRCALGPGKHELTLGAEPKTGKAMGLGIEVYGTSTAISGFAITRDDGADQTVVCVLRWVPFGIGGATVGWDGCSFVFTDGNGQRKNLIPGMSVVVDGIAYEVCVHRKYHL